MNLSERIKAAEAELVSAKDALIEMTKALEASPEDESILAQVEETASKVEKQIGTLDALRKAERALADRAAPAGAPAVVQAKHMGNPKANEDLFVKHAVAKMFAHWERKSLDEVISEKYGADSGIKAYSEQIVKSAVAPASTTQVGYGAELVRNDVRGFMDALVPESVVAALSSKVGGISFDGFNTLTIPRRNAPAAGQTTPAWVGEGGAIPVTNLSLGSMTLNRYKLGGICTMSNELRERSIPSIEEQVRKALLEAASQVLDGALLSTAVAVAGVRPAGLLAAGIFTAVTATAGGGYAAVQGDLKSFLAALIASNQGVRPILICNSVDRLSVSMMTSPLGSSMFQDELAAGRLIGMEVVSSTHVPKGTVVVLDGAGFVMANDAPEFMVSDVATIVESNADNNAPTMAGTDATPGAVGTPGEVPPASGIKVSGNTGASTTGYTARSMFQTYSTGIRMVLPQTWALTRPGGVAAITTGLSW